MAELDQDFRNKFSYENVQAYSSCYDETLRFMKGSDVKAFDLSEEPAEQREAYGRTKFGQGCLLARRLVAAGVRFVEVTSADWDMHNDLENGMEDLAPEFDQSFAALIADLNSRGLLQSTLVVVATEFGREPKWSGNGRGHYPIAFSTVLAGAGAKHHLSLLRRLA